MKNIQTTASTAAVLAFLLTTAGIASAQVCVDPAGGGCQLTIQAGVDVATAGQTVTVAADTYSETVTIPAGKDGLVIEASGALLDNPSIDDGIFVFSNDVTIHGLAIHNGGTGITVGDGTLVYPSGTVLSALAMVSSNDSCVELLGADDTLVTGSTFFACGGEAIGAWEGDDLGGADGLTVTKNRFRICDDGCIDLEGDDASIVGNRISQAEDDEGIAVYGDNTLVEKNTLSLVSGGVFVEGAHPVVVKNKVSGYSDDDAFEVVCTADCVGSLVSSNKASNGADDVGGFGVYADEAGMLVSKNSSTRAADYGFDIDGFGVVVTGNRAISSGGDLDESGFFVSGEGHELTGNSSSQSANDGFSIRGTGHVLTANTASANSGDGFDVDDYFGDFDVPTAIELTDNVATDNIGQGYAVASSNGDPADATLTGNTSSGNRSDFCNSFVAGTVTDGGGNSFVVAGAPACEVDHD